jgi:hypothetical protein
VGLPNNYWKRSDLFGKYSNGSLSHHFFLDYLNNVVWLFIYFLDLQEGQDPSRRKKEGDSVWLKFNQAKQDFTFLWDGEEWC